MRSHRILLLRRVALFCCAWIAGLPAALAAGLVLEIEAANPRGGAMQLFYDVGQPSSEKDSVRLPLPAGESLQVLRFPLPAEPIKLLRLDPADGPCVVHIGSMRLLANDGTLLKEIPPQQLRPMWQIELITFSPDGVAIVRSLPHANDPMLLIAEPVQAEVHRWLGRHTVQTRDVALLAAAAAALMLVAVGGALRSATSAGVVGSPAPRHHALMVCSAVFLIVAGARLAWLKNYSSPIPFWDEWEADALYLLIPFRGGFLDWQALFVPQAEHRIVLTRLITLAGTLLNGEWDPRLAMTLSAVMFAVATGLVAAIATRAGPRLGLVFAVAVAALGSFPFDVSNVFWGGQSQMYALVLLAIGSIALATEGVVKRSTFFAAGAAALLSLGTMGSGFIAPGIAAGLCAARALRERHQRRSLAGLAVLFGAIALAGILLRAESRRHGANYADTLGEFWRALEGFGAWPLPSGSVGLLVLWTPWLVHGLLLLRRREIHAVDWFALGLGAWALINTCGLAFARPDLAPSMDPRHFTALFMNVAAALVSAAALLRFALSPPRSWWLLLPAATAGAALVGMLPIEQRGVASTRQQPFWHDARDQILLPFLRSGDRALMQDLPFDGRCPYWNSATLAHYLESPLLQPVLPAKLRRAIAQNPTSPAPPESLDPGWLTLTARTFMKCGLALAAIGGLLLGWAGWRTRPLRPVNRAAL